jgi:hypothetical protein
VARTVYKVLGGKSYKDIGYMRGDPREGQIEKLVKKLRAMGVDIHHERHQMIYSVKQVKVDDTGIVVQ